MSELLKSVERVVVATWKPGLLLLGVSFVGATVASTLIGRFFMPKDARPATRPAPTVASISVGAPVPSLNQAAIDAILKRNIFDSEGPAGDAPAGDKKGDESKSQEVVKSDVPVKLMGTIYGGDPYSGIALVENETKKTINSFMVGDMLTKDVMVKEVHKERIIIDHSGRLEYVEVVTESLSRNRRAKKKAPATSAEPDIKPIATAPPPDQFKEDGLERKGHDTQMTQAYRQKLLTTDFTKVLQDAKATPNMVDGELKGFVLTRIRQDSIYEKAGLQNDDIVTEVNGVPLTDTAQAIRLLQSLRNESEIEVRILRGGSPQKFSLGIR
jgi:general secretion pathway protein C